MMAYNIEQLQEPLFMLNFFPTWTEIGAIFFSWILLIFRKTSQFGNKYVVLYQYEYYDTMPQVEANKAIINRSIQYTKNEEIFDE